MRIAILYICTGKYEIFWKDFYLSCEKNFINEAEIEYFVFTDSVDLYAEKNNPKIHKIFQENLGWPFNTLKRYEIFNKINNELIDFDYVFFFNSNLLFLETITKEDFLPVNEQKIVACLHPSYYNKTRQDFSYDNNPKSLAFIPENKGINYFAGGINGGETKTFLEVMKILSDNINTDLQNNVIALWHDESHWNKYLSENIGIVKILSPSFLYPENSNIEVDPRILIRNKDQFGHLESIRDVKIKFSKKFVFSVLKKIQNKAIYTIFKFYDYIIFNKKNIFKLKNTKSETDRKISVVITYHNRHSTIHKALYNILNNPKIDEILIVDDHSEKDSFIYLQQFVKKIDNPKIKILRNEINLGMFKNKIYSVSQAKNEWIILLDSDNTLTNKYIDSIFKIQNWDKNTMYCPSFAWPLINNEELANQLYTMESLKLLLIHNSKALKQFLNLGNFFVNKNEFMDTINEYKECIPYAADSIFINYTWLCKNNKIYIPKNCRYIHRVNSDSTWKAENSNSAVKFENIKNAILTLERDPKKII